MRFRLRLTSSAVQDLGFENDGGVGVTEGSQQETLGLNWGTNNSNLETSRTEEVSLAIVSHTSVI